MFDYMNGVMGAWPKTNPQWKENLFFAVKSARHQLSKYYTEVTLTTGMVLIYAYILDPFWKLRSFSNQGPWNGYSF
jgi:hypothetical protein